jgi:hypothetical protein
MGCLDGILELNVIIFMIAICILFCQVYALLSIYIFSLMQMHFYVPPEYDIMSIKWDGFKDMGNKLNSWRHGLKTFLKIQPGDTPTIVRARVEELMLSTVY